ncbi:MAG: hypothetical protein J0M04_11345 [Verrucomicrobia bacterium]|nr:hypothetical protein [Verrucomicrobiota bacterium]
MRFLVLLYSLLHLVSVVVGQDVMTVAKFKELVAAPGDTEPLLPELADPPVWPRSRCVSTMKFTDGRSVEEECTTTRKSIGGEFIVESFNSKFYGRQMHSIIGYDRKARAHRQWSLYGDKLIGSIVIFDAKKKVAAATITDGKFLELGVSSFSDREICFRVEVFKNGVLFLVREGREVPLPENGKSGNGAAGRPAKRSGGE